MKEKNIITVYHAHVYFQPHTTDSALALREALVLRFKESISLHSVAYGSRGPHVLPMFGVEIPVAIAIEVISFLLLHHGPHSILIHPVSGHELLDHTHHALWIGTPQPLDLSVLQQ